MAGERDDLSALDLLLPSPVEEIRDDRLDLREVQLLLKRDDLIHPDLPGNKWRKLKYNLATAIAGGHDTLLTFGGAYSNHLRATAAAGFYSGLRTIGVVRGEEHLPLNPSLAYAASCGMQLAYLDRTTYRAKHTATIVDRLRREFGDFFLLPEGGSNAEAVRGCIELPAEITDQFDVICCPVGTGGTLAGIAAGLQPHQRAIGFSALKGGEFLNAEVERLQGIGIGRNSNNWSIECGFHFGGFAKKTPELEAFTEHFAARHRVDLDRVYVGKMMYGLLALVERGAFSPGTRIVAVVTGAGDAAS